VTGHAAMKLAASSLDPPPGLRELLADLADGENGFSGTPVHAGAMTLKEYLQSCVDMTDPAKLKPGLVPQTTFWLLDNRGEAVGMVRVRHHLNDRLRLNGGHVGYYIRKDRRGRGYGAEILRLALIELRTLGEKRILVTVHPDNEPSIRVVEANGGRFEDLSEDPDTGAPIKRFWIELDPPRGRGEPR
jgi:predicted acetyltransferase